ncbi:MAG: hypothetical protein LBP75_09840 [Planctomycetota bacterium]|nr:hypothetical protein [Planctomycetota bacterium]
MKALQTAVGTATAVVPTGFLTEGKGKDTSIANKIRILNHLPRRLTNQCKTT